MVLPCQVTFATHQLKNCATKHFFTWSNHKNLTSESFSGYSSKMAQPMQLRQVNKQKHPLDVQRFLEPQILLICNTSQILRNFISAPCTRDRTSLAIINDL